MDTVSNSDDSSFTFKVDDVEIEKEPYDYFITAEEAAKQLKVTGKFEDFSQRHHPEAKFIDGEFTGFILALHTAYCCHYPLKISVSDFIILIGQGISKHINNHAEELRHEFVNHEGKEIIKIRRDHFVMGQQNDWSTVFGEFAEQIKKRVKTDIYDVIVDGTSVATPTSRIVSEITLMNAMKSYFEYMVMTCCGIPQITLMGSKKDWEILRTKVKKLVEMNKGDRLKLNWWLEHLVPVVEKLCDTGINRKVDRHFWSGIYKYEDPGSGTPEISGWITAFFPYVGDRRNCYPNPVIMSGDVPKQVCKVPFIWNYFGNEIPMSFYGGFLGAQFNATDHSVSPVHFWSVNYKEEEKEDEY